LAAAALFLAFQACDGPLPGYYTRKPAGGEEILIRGRIISQDEEEPIGGIAVYVEDVTAYYAYLTNDQGEFSFFLPKQDEYSIRFIDIDGAQNGGQYATKAENYTREEVEASSAVPLEVALTLLP
jgi:hypothetical protein